MMGTPIQNSGYGMQQQQQYWTPQGPYQQLGQQIWVSAT